MKEPLFDVFSGTSEKDAAWRESVERLSNAQRRMEQLAVNVPGAFLYSPVTRSILSSTSTAKWLQFERWEKKAGAA